MILDVGKVNLSMVFKKVPAMGWLATFWLDLRFVPQKRINALILNLRVATPLGVEQLFHRDHLRPSENIDINIIIYNSSKLVMK